MDDRIAKLKESVSLLPNEPGVYRFYDSSDTVIYVGKAKNLKKRVSSYFLAKNANERKTMMLVRKIARIEHIVVPSESDALLLENNLIKTLQPKYNILLKDDKTYPWIVVKNEEYPRIMPTRQVVRDGSKYYGPYTSITMQRNMLTLVKKLYNIRSCKLKLTEQGIKKHKFQRCLEYHIGNCKAPCEFTISREEYLQSVKMAEEMLKGEMAVARKHLKEEMINAADELRFEDAQQFKEKLEVLDNYNNKSVIVSPLYSNMDIFSIVIEENKAFCNYLYVHKGAVINSYTIEMKLKVEESKEEILAYSINRIMEKLNRSLAKEVIVPFLPDVEYFDNITFSVPQRGDKLKLLQLSEKNVKFYRLERMKQEELHNPDLKDTRLMNMMQKELQLDVQPRHIECFDNSNIQGEYPVSSCVVFRDGKPSRKEYRHFNIKTVEGIDDFASMRETVLRRYTRLLEEQKPLPQLIVVDGGKGQLSMAYKVLEELKLENKISIVGLAKRMEEIFYPNESDPLILDKRGETLRVLMHIRNEAHRFGITFHRDKRSKGAIHTELEEIQGVGKETIKKLLSAFKSVSKVKKASVEELSEVVGEKRAKDIFIYFLEKNKNKK